MLPTAEEQERLRTEQERLRADSAQLQLQQVQSQLQQTARNLLDAGMTVEQVAKLTGLNESEIRQLSN